MIKHDKEVRDEFVYRWGFKGPEYWSAVFEVWCYNECINAKEFKEPNFKILDYKNTWCEPYEGMKDGTE